MNKDSKGTMMNQQELAEKRKSVTLAAKKLGKQITGKSFTIYYVVGHVLHDGTTKIDVYINDLPQTFEGHGVRLNAETIYPAKKIN